VTPDAMPLDDVELLDWETPARSPIPTRRARGADESPLARDEAGKTRLQKGCAKVRPAEVRP
jgi:hypothetical protein